MSHCYAVVYVPDLKSEQGFKAVPRKSPKKCDGPACWTSDVDKDGLSASVCEGWRYCRCCPYVAPPLQS